MNVNANIYDEKNNTYNKILLGCIFLGIVGFLITTKYSILFLNKFNPVEGLLIYYFLLFFMVYFIQNILEYKIYKGEFYISKNKGVRKSLGISLIIMSFMIIISMKNQYEQYIIESNENNKISNLNIEKNWINFQSIDGSFFYIWYNLTKNIELSRILTFVISPIILFFIGSILIKT